MIQMMDGLSFVERIHEMSKRVEERLPKVQNEEAAKTALILPFLAQVLEWNPFDPSEVAPERVADVGDRKGEKCDYALVLRDDPVVLIEAKQPGDAAAARKAVDQLARYFHVTPTARVGVFSDGVRYRFFSDLDAPNVMDRKPFLEIDLSQPHAVDCESLEMFCRSEFDTGRAVAKARGLKYTAGIRAIFDAEFANPSDAFLRHLAGRLGTPGASAGVRAELRAVAPKAWQSFADAHAVRVVDERQEQEAQQAEPAAAKLPADEPPGDDDSGDGKLPKRRTVELAVVGDLKMRKPSMSAVRNVLLFRAIDLLGRGEVVGRQYMPRIVEGDNHDSHYVYDEERNVSVEGMGVSRILRCLKALSDRMMVPVRVEFNNGDVESYNEVETGDGGQ